MKYDFLKRVAKTMTCRNCVKIEQIGLHSFTFQFFTLAVNNNETISQANKFTNILCSFYILTVCGFAFLSLK